MELSIVSLIVIGEILTVLVTASAFQYIYSRRLAKAIKKLKAILAKKAREALKSRLQLEQLSREIDANGNVHIKQYTDYIEEELVKNQAKYNMLELEEAMSLSFDEPRDVRILSLRNFLLRTERQSALPGVDSDMPWFKLDENIRMNAKEHYQDDSNLPGYTPLSKNNVSINQSNSPAVTIHNELTEKAEVVNSKPLYDGYSSTQTNENDSALFDNYGKQHEDDEIADLNDSNIVKHSTDTKPSGKPNNYNSYLTEPKTTASVNDQSLDDNKKRKNEIHKQLLEFTDKLNDSSFENLMAEIQSIDDRIFDMVKNSEYQVKEVIMDYKPKDKEEHDKSIGEIKRLRGLVKEKQSEIKTLKEEIQKTNNSDLMKNIMDLQDDQLEIYKHQVIKAESHIETLQDELVRCQHDLERFKHISATSRTENLEKAINVKDVEIDHLKKELFNSQNNSTHREILTLKDEKIHAQEKQIKEAELAVETMEHDIKNTKTEIRALKRALIRARESIDQANLLQKENKALSEDNQRLQQTISNMEHDTGFH